MTGKPTPEDIRLQGLLEEYLQLSEAAIRELEQAQPLDDLCAWYQYWIKHEGSRRYRGQTDSD